jgi:hypothetical protein
MWNKSKNYIHKPKFQDKLQLRTTFNGQEVKNATTKITKYFTIHYNMTRNTKTVITPFIMTKHVHKFE